jgi:uncharacterized protein (DUF983 family)
MSTGPKPGVSPVLSAASGRCPACGRGRLFRGYLGLAPCCDACGLDYAFADAGDGPAVLIMLITGFAATGGALVVEALYSPPYWLHAALWAPLAILLPLLLLRPAKGLMIGLQHRNAAAEGRLE